MNDAIRTVPYLDRLPEHAVSWALDMGREGQVRLRVVQDLGDIGAQWPQREDLWIWFGAEISNNAVSAFSELADCLPHAELERAVRFRFAQDRWSYTAAHAGLRLLLARILSEDPRDIALQTLPGGKLALCPSRYTAQRAASLQFSISHSRGLVAVAISGSPVGVDVERVRLLPDMEALIERFMACEALVAFRTTQDVQDRAALFYRNWTLGEAFVKATGEGIDQGLASFAFTQVGSPVLTRITPGWGPMERWRFGHTPRLHRKAYSTPAVSCHRPISDRKTLP